MLYLANPSRGLVNEAMVAGLIGCITTPKQGNVIPGGAWWCADNGKYGKGWPGGDKWYAWLARTVQRYGHERCLFAVAPDVPFDARGTLAESTPWLTPIRSLGIPAALCAQDGLENMYIPWSLFDVLFIAGSTEWKLTGGMELAHEAKRRGLGVHVGRVNSRKRFNTCEEWGADSCDGTFLTYGPRVNLPKLLAWPATPRQTTLEEQIRNTTTEGHK